MMQFSQDQNQSPDSGNQDRRDEARNVVQISQFREMDTAPVFALVDLQMEFVSSGRAYAISDIEACLERCAMLLEQARSAGLAIAHFRQIRRSTYFNGASPFADWIDTFKPHGNEMVFERAMPSCYSNHAFCTYMEGIRNPTIVLAGLSGEEACLSTAVDALHRGHDLIFVQDASASRATRNFNEQKTHEVVSDIISVYAEITSSAALTDRLKQLPRRCI